MSSETSLNPPTGVLPFEMFRTFSTISFMDLAPTGPQCEIKETERECVVAIAISLPLFVDTTKISAELRNGVLMVTLPKREEIV